MALLPCYVRGKRVAKIASWGKMFSCGSKAIIGNNVKIQNNVERYDTVFMKMMYFCGPSLCFLPM
jgi:UDP-2-acetamido-3-amino-2,3-dideoxy-glucuronate N-acetyltransferase